MIKDISNKILTIDANVVSYYFSFTRKHTIPRNIKIKRMNDFCFCVINKFPIAINDYIRAEYEKVYDFEYIKNWLKDRLQKNLAIDIACTTMPREIKNCIRDDYGFNCRETDFKYLLTCLNTNFKCLVTENKIHFFRRKHNKKGKSMPVFLKQKLNIQIFIIDECCKVLLDCQSD